MAQLGMTQWAEGMAPPRILGQIIWKMFHKAKQKNNQASKHMPPFHMYSDHAPLHKRNPTSACHHFPLSCPHAPSTLPSRQSRREMGWQKEFGHRKE